MSTILVICAAFYLMVASGVTIHAGQTIYYYSNGKDPLGTFIAAILIGIFWPVGILILLFR